MNEDLKMRARELMQLRERAADLQQQADAAKRERNEHEALLFAAMEDQGYSSLTVDIGPPYGPRRITRRVTTYPRVLDKDAVLEDLEARGIAHEFVKGELRKQALNQFVRSCQETGEPLPRGVDTYDDKGITIATTRRR